MRRFQYRRTQPLFSPPLRPAFIGELVLDPFRMLRLGLVRRSVAATTLAEASTMPTAKRVPVLVIITEVQPASVVTAVWLASADVRDPAIYFGIAPGVIAECRHPIPDIARPLCVEAY